MVSNNLFTRTILRFKFLRQLWQPGTIYSEEKLSDIVRVASFYIKCQPTVFIVFSYRRSSYVRCADRHWKLVYRWISAHITLLVEHTPISGSFMFLLYNQSSVSSALSVFSKKKIRVNPCHPWEKKKPPRALHTKRLFNGYR